jgi:hypothetical protein
VAYLLQRSFSPQGFTTADQIVKALAIQTRENGTEGEYRLLGRTLLDQRAITASQIDEILEALSKTMEYVLALGR